MIEETVRENLYSEVEKDRPLSRPASAAAPGQGARFPAPGKSSDVALELLRETAALKEQVKAELLWRLHTLFEFPAEDAEVHKAVAENLEDLYRLEKACEGSGSYDAHGYALFLLRRMWFAAAAENGSRTPGKPDLLPGVRHLERAGFFRKVPQEIASWTQLFLAVERYHRLGAREHESWVDRHRAMRAASSRLAIGGLDDLLIWLEFGLLADPHYPETDIGLFSRKAARELEGRIAPELFAGMPLQPVLYVLLRTHRFCMAETLEPDDRRRLEQVRAARRMDSLLDLMRLVVQSTLNEQRLPDAGRLLDRLQAEGFNIGHTGFRDPYEAELVPPADAERFETCRLPVFYPLDRLTGDFAEDLGESRRELLDSHRRVLNELAGDCLAFASAAGLPMPRARLIRPAVRFATSWVLALSSWPVARQAADLAAEIRALLPEDAVRKLVRPRKGYEIKSKQDLAALIAEESRRQLEALERIAVGRAIQGLHDYAEFARYAILQHLQGLYGPDPAEALLSGRMDPLNVSGLGDSQWVLDAAKKWAVDTRRAHPHSLESVREYILEICPAAQVAPQMEKAFVASENEWLRIFGYFIDLFVPACYRLTAANGRHAAQLPRLQLGADWQKEVPMLVSLLVPPLEALERAARDSAGGRLARWGNFLYRDRLRPVLSDASEWEAWLTWEIRRRMGEDPARFLEEGDLEVLLEELKRAAMEVDFPDRELLPDTVASTVVKILSPSTGAEVFPDADVRELQAALPQMDCGACGQPSCREFARCLLASRAEPEACVQLAAHLLPPLLLKLAEVRGRSSDGSASAPGLLDTLQDRFNWDRSPHRDDFRNVLSARVQKARAEFLDRAQKIWDALASKPQIFVRPDPEALYAEIRRHLGYEAAERLLPEERQYLVEHGDLRHEAVWNGFKKRQDWLHLANQARRSRPLLRSEDPSCTASEGYRNVFFLNQLRPRDRALVLHSRFERFQEGFSHWWNEDLLAMNQPGFSIRDWEDFSKVIKNAYWHQESSLAAGDALDLLKKEWAGRAGTAFEEVSLKILGTWLSRTVNKEADRIEKEERISRDFRAGQPVRNLSDLRLLARALVRETLGPADERSDEAMLRLAEDRRALDVERVWLRFQDQGFVISPAFSCRCDEFVPSECESLGVFPAETLHIADWSEPVPKRVQLIRTVIDTAVREWDEENAECDWLLRTLESGRQAARPPLKVFESLIRRRLAEKQTPESTEKETAKLIKSAPGLEEGLADDILHGLIRQRQCRVSAERSTGSDPSSAGDNEDAGLLDDLEELRFALDGMLEKNQAMDRDRLLRYLFLLARMEGNLDSLTALLREIRETSDVIEAAWLRFTEERIMEGPAPKIVPGAQLGIPLLVSLLKDKEAANRCLREGIGRREKANVAAAVRELLGFIRFHVLEADSRNGDPESVLQDFNQAGYDVSGIQEETLRAVVKKEWDRRGQLQEQKIGIYTMATARKLAAQNQEFQEIERELYKERSEILREKGGGDLRIEEVASRRGVALGQIKDAMYRSLSDLLEPERIGTFQKRIAQIVGELDRKRDEIFEGAGRGELNPRTMFHILRRFQKMRAESAWEELRALLLNHWLLPLAELRGSRRPDREDRIRDRDEKFKAVLGVSLLEVESDADAAAAEQIGNWMLDQGCTI